MTLEAAQTILNSELNRLIDKRIEDYGLIWTEIAEWAEMETWLLYYGQRFSDLTCFNAALTMDIRNETYHHMIIPYWEIEQVIYEDVPLASWSVLMNSVGAFLSSRKDAKAEILELGYLMEEKNQDHLLIPVWRLSYVSSSGYNECYFSAQTGEQLLWEAEYILPEPFGW